MNEENVHSGVLFNHKKWQNYVICRKMDGPGGHHKDKYYMFYLTGIM
jgi:hypothetical protein